jgi:hypothetical protein
VSVRPHIAISITVRQISMEFGIAGGGGGYNERGQANLTLIHVSLIQYTSDMKLRTNFIGDFCRILTMVC